MFKKIREITDENGVKSIKEYNPVKEKFQKFGYDVLEFVAVNGNYIWFALFGH